MSGKIGKQFEQDGYVVVENMFSPEEVVSFKQEIRRIVMGINENDKGVVQGAADFSNGVYVGLALKSEMFRQLAADARIGAALREIIGDRVLFLSDKVVAKDAAKDFPSPWHQDYPYWEGSHKYSVWIALDDAVPENGCLKIIPGTHRGTIAHRYHDNAKEGFGNRLHPEDIDESQAVTIEAKAGTAVIFHDLTVHSSYPNVSGKDRWALISTYKDATQPDPDYKWANPIPVDTGH